MSSSNRFREIDDQTAFESFLDLAATSTRYAIDTEFHRERTYYPDLALLQVKFRTPDGAVHGALIDPKPLDLSPLAALFTSPALALMHAPTQDFDVFDHEVGCLPSRFFDTQLAAGFLGLSSASLASLVQRYAKVSLSKGDRLSDWNRRPLSPAQKAYAYSDVEHLEAIVDAQIKDLQRRSRLSWAEAAFAELLADRRPPTDPYEAWRFIPESRNLDQPRRGALVELAAWRERRAMEMNLPPRRICSDIVLVCIAQRLPCSESEFSEVRGFTRSRVLDPSILLPLIATGARHPLPPPSPRKPPVDQRAVALVTAYVADVAARQEVDRSLLATRDDVEDFLAGTSTKLTSSWRAELVKDVPARLAAGSLGLAIDPAGGFRLIPA